MLAADRMPMTDTFHRAARPNRKPTLRAGHGVCLAMGLSALCARGHMIRAEQAGTGRRGTLLQVNLAVETAAGRVSARRCARAAANLSAGAAQHLIFRAGDLVAACTLHYAVGTDGRVINVAAQHVLGATGMPAG